MTALLDYVKQHTVTTVGNSSRENVVFVETIVEDPIELIRLVTESGCYISEILWWDRTPINEASPIGYGGPLDPRDSKNYFFAETYLQDSFDAHTTQDEYIAYLDKIKQAYPDRDLYPGFDVCTQD